MIGTHASGVLNHRPKALGMSATDTRHSGGVRTDTQHSGGVRTDHGASRSIAQLPSS